MTEGQVRLRFLTQASALLVCSAAAGCDRLVATRPTLSDCEHAHSSAAQRWTLEHLRWKEEAARYAGAAHAGDKFADEKGTEASFNAGFASGFAEFHRRAEQAAADASNSASLVDEARAAKADTEVSAKRHDAYMKRLRDYDGQIRDIEEGRRNLFIGQTDKPTVDFAEARSLSRAATSLCSSAAGMDDAGATPAMSQQQRPIAPASPLVAPPSPARDGPTRQPRLQPQGPGPSRASSAGSTQLPSNPEAFANRYILIVGTYPTLPEAKAKVDDTFESTEGLQQNAVLDTTHYANLRSGLFIVVEAMGSEDTMQAACKPGIRECYVRNTGAWVP